MSYNLQWGGIPYDRHALCADVSGLGRFSIGKRPYARKDAWFAKFRGRAVTANGAVTIERGHGRLSSADDARKVCQRWADEFSAKIEVAR